MFSHSSFIRTGILVFFTFCPIANFLVAASWIICLLTPLETHHIAPLYSLTVQLHVIGFIYMAIILVGSLIEDIASGHMLRG